MPMSIMTEFAAHELTSNFINDLLHKNIFYNSFMTTKKFYKSYMN